MLAGRISNWPNGSRSRYLFGAISDIFDIDSSAVKDFDGSAAMDWKTWSPFQSAAVKQICDHMTDSERFTAMRRGGQYGLWVAGTCVLPAFAVVGALGGLQSPTIIGIIGAIAVTLILVHICCIPAWLSAQRRFLCSTQWAREQGIRPENLR